MADEKEDTGPSLEELMAEGTPGAEQISLEEPEKDDDDASEAEPEPQTRKQKRQARGQLRKEAEAQRERADRLERELQEFKEKSEREGRENFLRQVQQAQQQRPQGPDPLDKELEGVHAREDSILARYNALPEDQRAAKQAEYLGEMRKLEAEKTAIAVRKAMGANPQQNHQPSQREIGNAILASRFPDVFRNQKAQNWGWARYQQLLADGKADGLDLAAQAMQEAAEHYGLASPPDARQTDKNRHMSTSRAGRATEASETKTFVMTPLWKSMADESHSHIKNPGERYRVWAREVGTKLKASGA